MTLQYYPPIENDTIIIESIPDLEPDRIIAIIKNLTILKYAIYKNTQNYRIKYIFNVPVEDMLHIKSYI